MLSDNYDKALYHPFESSTYKSITYPENAKIYQKAKSPNAQTEVLLRALPQADNGPDSF